MKRSKGKYKTEWATKEFYERYSIDTFKEKGPSRVRGVVDKTSPFYISKVKFTEVLKDLMDEIKTLLINEAFDWIMPSRIGKLLIVKKKVKLYIDKEGVLKTKPPIDWGETLKLKQRGINAVAYHLNEHTDGFKMKVYLDKGYAFAKVPYYGIYKLESCRAFDRELAHALKTNPQIDFYEHASRKVYTNR